MEENVVDASYEEVTDQVVAEDTKVKSPYEFQLEIQARNQRAHAINLMVAEVRKAEKRQHKQALAKKARKANSHTRSGNH
jgi:hypothetical protein